MHLFPDKIDIKHNFRDEKVKNMEKIAVKLVNNVIYKRKLSYEQNNAFCMMLDYLIIETNLATNPNVAKRLKSQLVTLLILD